MNIYEIGTRAKIVCIISYTKKRFNKIYSRRRCAHYNKESFYVKKKSPILNYYFTVLFYRQKTKKSQTMVGRNKQ